SRSCLAAGLVGIGRYLQLWSDFHVRRMLRWLSEADKSRSAGEEAVHELLLAVDERVDSPGGVSIRLAQLAPEQGVAVAINANAASWGRVERQYLTHSKGSDFAKRPLPLLQDGPQ